MLKRKQTVHSRRNHQLAHSVFRNSRISLRFRERLANSLCSSRLKFGVYTTPTATAQIHNVRVRNGTGLIGKNRFSSCDSTTDGMALEELQWLPADLFLLKERLSPLAKLCKGGSKQWQTLRRVAIGAMETLPEDLRSVREASATLRRMPEPYDQREPWINLLEKEYDSSMPRCSRPKKPEGVRYMAMSS